MAGEGVVGVVAAGDAGPTPAPLDDDAARSARDFLASLCLAAAV